ncbi:MAG TPA: DUF485 domain-containing protein [Terriglobales bacterium]|nr:DUF485 domain-containing protein [Terriglobales bacterium]
MSTAVPKLKPKPDLRVVPDKWAEAYESATFKEISRKRFSFVIPALLSFSAVFLVLWIIQSMFPAVARYRVYGYVNVNFIYTMAIFPFVWILGFLFVRYIRSKVYPLERELNRQFERGPKQ